MTFFTEYTPEKSLDNDFDDAPTKSNWEEEFERLFLKGKHEGMSWEVAKPQVINLLNQHSAHLVASGKYNSDKLWGEGYYKGIMDERNRIEEVFKKEVPPHAMDIEDSVWLKRLLNKAFNHDKNI